ncbi:MAG: CDP-diacylglycerol--glycerol-3-phosphate 3-phosphatidyltransferase [Gammaproteobacteria bacterium]|nr:CDP-diacylglycerol--glycerol-3-phosphate 3-phosphatidyltransferase [Gammaproteobacteria bacterium]
MMYTLPNMLTLSRIVAIPVIVAIFYLPVEWNFLVASLIFIAAALTDLFDGYLARKLNQTTKLGAFLDPVADKLIVAVALILLVEVYASPWMAIPAIVIIGREIIISALREWMAECGHRAQVAVSNIGKVKTVIQMFAISMVLMVDPIHLVTGGDVFWRCVWWIGVILLYIATVLTLWSAYIYLKAAWPNLMNADGEE